MSDGTAPVNAAEHLDWVRVRVALPVVRRYRLRGQEAGDVIQTAVVALLEVVAGGRFDPALHPPGSDLGGAFRGWAYPTLRCACVRAVLEMRGGGTFRTVRPEHLVTAAPLGDAAEAVPVEEREAEHPDGAAGAKMVDAKPSAYGRTFRSARRPL